MLRNTVKDLGKHSLIYLIGGIASVSASILLMPVYTRFLSKADYGIIEMIDTSRYLVIILLLAGFDPTMGKFYHSSPSADEKKAVVGTVFLFVLLSAIFWGGCLFSLNTFLSEQLLGRVAFVSFINLGIMLLVVQAIQTTGETYLNIRKKSLLFATLSLIKLTINILANLTFVVWLRIGPKGMLYGELLSSGIITIVLLSYLIRNNGLHFSTTLFRPMLLFSLPFIPNAFSAAIMHRADRYFVQQYGSLADVGLYGVGYRFPFILNSLILSSFGRVWYSASMYDIAKQEEAQRTHAKITTYFVTLYMMGQYLLAIFAPTIIRLLTAPDYFEAWKVMQIVAFACALYAIHPFFTSGAFLKNKTWVLPISHIIPAALNIGLNMLLLPRYGYIAAAWVTVITYFTYSFLNYLICRAFYPIKFEFGRLSWLFGGGIALVLLSDAVWFSHPVLEALKEFGFAAVFPLAIMFGKYLDADEKQSLSNELARVHPTIARFYRQYAL
ncbi:polysaccharide biosynthesis protein [Candidatus Moduliflexus flocculans]|uniref:Polysaccharide biosynthesis protein n=1 Tax=Candidatus Moduliflexus flocculans TaxID=1499966 RepID=A0A081BLZ7_9BACT|nr:polysaccharide biosynthesis protein [Candidatus Moduliflexus flocculans]